MKLEDLQYDKDFMDKLADADNVETIKALLASRGFEMSDEDIKEALEQADSGVLSEGDLESVAGGYGVMFYIGILIFLIGVARGARC